MWAKNLFNPGMQCLTWQCLPRLWTCRASHRVLRLDMSLTLNQCARSASTRLLKECSIYVICQLSVNVERAGSRSAASPLGQGCDLDSRTIVPRRKLRESAMETPGRIFTINFRKEAQLDSISQSGSRLMRHQCVEVGRLRTGSRHVR